MDLFGRKATAAKLLQLENKVTEQAAIIDHENKLSELVVLQEKSIAQRIESVMRHFNTQIYAKYNTGVARNAYQTVSNFYSVVSTLANECAGIPFRPEMKKKGTEVSDNDKVWAFIDLLPLDKRIACYTFYLIQGEIFIYKEKLEYGVNAGIINMVPLNPLNVSVFITEGFPVEILGYRYLDSLHGITVDILPEDMVFVKNFNPSEDLNLQVRGLAPADVLMQPLTRESASMETSIAQIQNGGLPGIVYDKTPGVTAEVVGARRDSFGRYLRNSANKGAPYFAANELDYIEIGSKLVDMDLSTLSSDNLDMICNVFHVSSTEFNNKSASTESNVSAHSESFYTRGVLPVVRLLIDGLNRQALADVNTKAILKEDTSDIPELQQDYTSMAQGLAAQPFIIPNDMFEKLGWKRRTEAIYDEVWAKSGYMPAEDAAMPVEDITPVEGDVQAPVVPLKRASNG